MEFYKNKELNGLERDVLALYKYYTENGKNRCCSLTCQQIADEFNISIWHVNKIKKHLKELGYIMTSGIRVTYIGTKDCTTVQSEDCTTVQSKTVPQYRGSVPQYREDCTTVQSNTVPQYRHKKEKEEKEEKKKEEKREMTNLDQLLNRLPKYYKTPETMEFIKNNLMEKINQADLSDGLLEFWVARLKKEILKRFDIYPIINKPVVPETKPEDDFIV